VLALLTSQYHARTLPPDARTFEGMRYEADEEDYEGGWVNSCCLKHERTKKRRGEHICPSNAEFRVIRVRCGEVLFKYVVLLAALNIPKDKEILAYYYLSTPGPPPAAPAKDKSEGGANGEGDAQQDSAGASTAPSEPLARFRGRVVQRGSGRAEGGESKGKGEAHNTEGRSAARGIPGVVRCHCGRQQRGARAGPSGAASCEPSGAAAQTAAPGGEPATPTRAKESGAGANPGSLPTYDELSFDTSDEEKQQAINEKRVVRSLMSMAADQHEEHDVSDLEEEVPETQADPDATHSAMRGQSVWE